MLEHLGYEADPDRPGWEVRRASTSNVFLDCYGEMATHVEGERLTRLRITPAEKHRNAMGTVHGGFLLALVDHCLFVGPGMLGVERSTGGASTIDCSAQFIAAVKPGEPVDVLIETLRDTYRMVFVRGTIEQNGTLCVAFSGTIKKASARP